MADQPWHELPREIALVLRPLLADVTDEMIEAVRTIPVYARPLEGEFGKGLRAGVEQALNHFLEEIEAGGPVPRSEVYMLLGRGELHAGRKLESLLSAYRVGARVAWRRFAAAGTEAGLEPDTLYLLAESIFAYIDVLSAESAEGYALEQSAVASETELRRRRLVRLLVRRPAVEPAVIEAAADDAGWTLPRALAALAIPGSHSVAGLGLPADAIAERVGELTCAIVPDPDGPGRRSAIEGAIAELGITIGVGTTVGWPEAGRSFGRARAAVALADGRPGVVRAQERTGELLLRSDRELARELVRHHLAPLEPLTAGARARLTETLRAWLAEQGRLGPVAERLSVHPQTARYRLTRLRELFGPALDDPDQRFWLDLALRASELEG
jgi:PucR C-terminal helix-turn-helix domain